MVTIEEDVKVVQVGNSLRIAIPAVFCKALGIVQGDTVHLKSTDHEILLQRLASAKSILKKKGSNFRRTERKIHSHGGPNPGGPTNQRILKDNGIDS